jgi:pseudaminic acid synthase
MLIIDGREISSHVEPYIIAELSANHNGSIDKAKASIKAAKDAGAHAIKLQTYTPDTMTIDCDKADFMIKGGLWGGSKLYDLYTSAHTPYEWHQELFGYAKAVGITCFSTPFDETAIELLEDLGAPAYKIASFELTDLNLIKHVASTGKPLLLSTGMASELEIFEAVNQARASGCKQLLLFHCVSNYPSTVEDMNLNMIMFLKKTYDVDVGLSDHTLGNVAAISSIALGAIAIEKHFTINRNEKGPDSEFSIEPIELTNLVCCTRDAWLALGSTNFSRPESEKLNLKFRRSIYFVKDLKAGEIITEKDIKKIRPGFGLPPKYYDQIVGAMTTNNVNRGDPVTWQNVKIK